MFAKTIDNWAKVWYNMGTERKKCSKKRKNEVNKMTARYDELKVNDVVRFHGADVRIKKIVEHPAPANEWYPNEKTIDFEIEPANDEALKVLGKFYAYGNYGGVGCLELPLVKRA